MENNVKKEHEVSDVARREEEVLAFWNERDIFNKSLLKDAPNGDFVFYDGPPFATGLPHYGHILAGTIKDAIPRFWTMNGYRVRRKWGWDCHGLPLENLIEKKLGLATKRDIEEYGVKNFNEAARGAVLEYADDWKQIIPRMGRWADMDDDYKTMDSTYTESVWWVFNRLHEKGLVYEGFKSMHLCPRCGTTLSNFEVNQGYKDIKDIAVTVRLPLVDEPDTSLLVWTTTPWTLPGNMAAAVHNDHEYVVVEVTTETGVEKVILAKARLAQLGTDSYKIVKELNGAELVGKSYIPPFNYFTEKEFEGKENAWKIYHAEYVTLGEEGTGAVHIAPAYGEDDMTLAKENQIPIVHHVDHDGHFMDFVTDFAGKLVKPKDDDDAGVMHLDADIEIVRALQQSGRIFKKENITHSYPHCWRCDTPLLNYATTSWFVKVTDIKDKLVAENDKVHWVPEHVGRSRFGKWLEGARDWAISRQRYWGAPLPIWKNPTTKAYKVFGSLEELSKYVRRSGNTYFVMRHAESESNITGRIDAIPDEENPLTEKGKEQSILAGKELKEKKIDLIIHSGMQRARQTAELVAKELGLPAESVLSDERLTEIQVGIGLEGKTWEEHDALYKDEKEKFTKEVPGTENRRGVQKRVGDFLYEVEKTYQGKNILIVGHASSTFALRAVAVGADMDQAIAIRREGYLGNAEVREVPFTPLPHNDNYELDFHRPYIDEIELFDEDGTKMVRVPDVFDCWFESGSMPCGEMHHPFENTDVFDPEKGKGYPAHFIAEGLDQTRGWFYSLIVLGTALFGKSPYQNVIVNGTILAEDGQKMSKRLQNYPDPMAVANNAGADAMRFYLLSSSVMRSEDLHFSEKGVLELQRKNIGRLHNVLAMYEMYADGTKAHGESTNVLDRWIVSLLNKLVHDTTKGFKNYELDMATRPLTDFIDDLSVWYLRRSRDRFKGADLEDKQNALSTLRHVLRTLSLVMAPSMPFYAEYLWGRIREEGDVESVHLADWPQVLESFGEIEIITEMAAVREIVTKALEARTKANIKVRQPIAQLKIPTLLGSDFSRIVADEVNVKEVKTDESLQENVWIDTTITPELKREGAVRDLMREIQEKRKEMGLSPSDRILLNVDAETKELMSAFEDMVRGVVGAEKIEVGDGGGSTLSIDGTDYHFEVTKI